MVSHAFPTSFFKLILQLKLQVNSPTHADGQFALNADPRSAESR